MTPLSILSYRPTLLCLSMIVNVRQSLRAGYSPRSAGARPVSASGDRPAVAIPTSLPRVGCGLAHGLQVRGAALLEQAAHVAMEILHPEAQKLGNERVGAATPGNAPGVGDYLDAALHHLLHLRVGLLAGVAHRLGQVAGA